MTVSLPGAEPLTIQQANQIARRTPVNVVAVFGPVKSGKTTLIAMIYDSLQRGDLTCCEFAGSDTLWGFERLCHNLRIASNRTVQDMQHTPRADSYQFLHLRVRDPLNDRRYEFLFPDITGELFEEALDSTEDTESLSIIRRADQISLLADGEKLVSPIARQRARADIDTFIRSCLEVGVMDRSSIIQIVVTKSDLLPEENDDRFAEVSEFLQNFENDVTSKYRDRVGSLQFLRVAALPKAPSSLGAGHGIAQLIEGWLRSTKTTDGTPDPLLRPESDREFDSFQWRVATKPRQDV